MAFQLSPGVNISEIDLTTVVPSVATTDGAIGGIFRWGPIGERVLVDSEKTLVQRFGKPTNLNAETFFSASNFLAYGNRLYVSRAAQTTGADDANGVLSAVASSNNTLTNTDILTALVKNENHYTTAVDSIDSDILYTAKYPGELGNSLKISICDSPNAYNSNVTVGNTSTDVPIKLQIGSNTTSARYANASGNTLADAFVSSITVGDNILVGNASVGEQYMIVKTIGVGAGKTNDVTLADTSDSSVVVVDDDFIAFDNSDGGFEDGDIVTYVVGTGTDIGGLSDGSTYFVASSNTTGFKLSSTAYGTPITITGVGSGDATFTNDTLPVDITFENSLRLKEDIVLSNTVQRFWEYHNVVDTAPGQSNYQAVSGNTSAQDEMHIVVVDEDGEISGVPGTVLEVYQGLSRATDAKNNDNSVNYYKEVINDSSNYIWFANDRSGAVSNTATSLASSTNYTPLTLSMYGARDGYSESTATLSVLGTAYDLFASAENVDISLVLQGKPVGGTTSVNGETVSNYQLANYIIDNICETRKDCIALISPDRSKVLNNSGSEATGLKNWRGAVNSTSYAVLDSGYKYQYDRYNDIYRWIPLNGDIAGLCARTDSTNDAWWSPAGFNRGNIKNVIKLAWNPNKAERDVIYSNGINPVVTFPGQGTVLFGDKTLQAKPSAFDRINVRRLFIVLEKAISTSARFSLFEFNDPFTRSQFKNLVTPFLRNIQGRRGITDFLVVCDETNNTAQVVDSNQFVGDIYIKPARSINFIQLNFVAVGTGVQFSEVVGGV
jgi:hypothetical protein